MNIHQQAQVPVVTVENFDRQVGHSSVPVLVNFQTPWSTQMEPLLGQVAEAFAGRLRVVQVDTSADPELAARFKIRAVPTMLIFDKGVPVEFIVGTVPSRFVFETVCKALRVKYPTTVRQRRKASNWPSNWQLAFDATSI